MAWIKIEHWTPEKPEIYHIAEILKISPDQVVGALVRIWIWADQQTINGNAPSVTLALLDYKSGVTGFGDAMQKAGWLKGDENGLQFVNFGKHNGETAKARILTAKRVAKSKQKSNGDSVTFSVTEPLPNALPRVRIRDRDINNNPPLINNSPKTFQPPTIEEVTAYCQERKRGVDPERWFNFYASKGWMVGKNKMKDWKAAVRTWEKEKEQEKDYRLWTEERPF